MSFHFLQSDSKLRAHIAEYASGFGLIELMVSISIMVIVTGVILARQDSFNSAILLRSQAYEIALGMREVQLNAVSASGFNDGSGTTFRARLGTHFSTTVDDTYRIFRDCLTTCNWYYDGAGEEFGLQNNIDPRFEVADIRLYTSVGGMATVSNLSILFERPNFDARFFTAANTEAAVSRVEIDIANRETGDVRTIEVTPTGQIAVQ